ncbi:MAG: fibronectin type III domain-containing protein, partial [bacterium]
GEIISLDVVLLWTETGLSANTSYYRYAEAYNASGSSASVPAVKYTLANPPENLTASATGNTINLSWSPASSGGNGSYDVETTTGSQWSALIGLSTSPVLQQSDLDDDTTYYYRVYGYNSDGSSRTAESAGIASAATVPTAPADFGMTLSTGSITYSWTDNSKTETSYYICTDTGGRLTQNLGANVTSYIESGLGPDILYKRKIEAGNSAGSVYSAALSRKLPVLSELVTRGSTVTIRKGGVSVDVSSDSFGEDGYIKISTDPVNNPIEVDTATIITANGKLTLDENLLGVSESLAEFKAYNLQGATITFVSSVTISLPYSSSDGKFVDGYSSPKIPVASLAIYVLDEAAAEWKSVSRTVDTAYKVVKATVAHFSVYMLIGEPLTLYNDLSGVVVYPNPYKPGSGGDYDDAAGGGIVFAKLTENVKIKIFNIAGELVKELNHTSGSTESWTEARNQASGVYIYVVSGSSGKKTGKFAIIK